MQLFSAVVLENFDDLAHSSTVPVQKLNEFVSHQIVIKPATELVRDCIISDLQPGIECVRESPN